MNIFKSIRVYFNIRPDLEEKQEIIEEITRGISFRGANLWILITAIFIASLGLNVNSTAVIIGAMLISPLMGPIIGMGLAVGINDLELLKACYRKVMRLLVQLSAPIIVVLMVLAHPLYHFLFGEKWMEAAVFFQILCLAGILYPLIDYNVNILLTKGRSDLFLRLDITRRVIGVAATVIALVFRDYWGIQGLLWSQVICQVIFLFINSYYSGRFIQYTIWRQLIELLPFFLMSGVSGLAVWSVDAYLTSGLSDFLRLAIGGIVMGAAYLVLLYTFARRDLFYVWVLLQEHLLKRKV